MREDEFVQAGAYENALAAVYARDDAWLSSRLEPVPDLGLAEGVWLIDRFAGLYGRDIAQLRRVDPARLQPTEDTGPDRLADVERYRDWLAQGLVPPPIQVVEREDGSLAVIDGHRRRLAALAADAGVLAWVSPLTDAPILDTYGRPLRTGLTWELARAAHAFTSEDRPQLDFTADAAGFGSVRLRTDDLRSRHEALAVATIEAQGRDDVALEARLASLQHFLVLAYAHHTGVAPSAALLELEGGDPDGDSSPGVGGTALLRLTGMAPSAIAAMDTSERARRVTSLIDAGGRVTLGHVPTRRPAQGETQWYVSTGANTGRYTLRSRWCASGGRVVDRYVRSLAKNWDDALVRARVFVAAHTQGSASTLYTGWAVPQSDLHADVVQARPSASRGVVSPNWQDVRLPSDVPPVAGAAGLVVAAAVPGVVLWAAAEQTGQLARIRPLRSVAVDSPASERLWECLWLEGDRAGTSTIRAETSFWALSPDRRAPASRSGPPRLGGDPAAPDALARRDALSASDLLERAGLSVSHRLAKQTGRSYWTVSGDLKTHAGLLDQLGAAPPLKILGRWSRSLFDGDPTARLVAVLRGAAPDAPAPEGPPLAYPQARLLLAKQRLRVEPAIEDGGWLVSGQTYAHRTLLQTLGGQFRGGVGWRFVDDISVALATALAARPAEPAAGVSPAVGPSAGNALAERRAKLQVRMSSYVERRQRRSGELDWSLDDTTVALLERGRAVQIPADVIRDQITDASLITEAYRAKNPLFLLTNEAGTGKTFVVGAAIRELRRLGVERFVWLTLSKELIEQAKADLRDFDLSGVAFHTYAELSHSKRIDVLGGVLIADECQNLKNIESARAKAGKVLLAQARLTVASSATPFENPLEAEYLGATGVFDPVGGFRDWAVAFGADPRTRSFFDPKREKERWVEELRWPEGRIEEAKAARAWFLQLGAMTHRPMRIDPGLVEVVFQRQQIAPEYVELYNRVTASYAAALAGLTLGDGSLVNDDMARDIARHRETLIKRILEASKIPLAIELAREHLAAGRSVAIFVETKAEREIGRWRTLRSGPGAPTFDYPQLAAMMAEWRAEAAIARQLGDRAPPAPFAEFIEEIARAFHERGIRHDLPATADAIVNALGGPAMVGVYTGAVTEAEARKAKNAFVAKVKPVLVLTMAKGGVGLSLHDTVGDRPTVQINVNLPWRATGVDQVRARTARYGLRSPVRSIWLFAANIPWEAERLAPRVGRRMAEMGAVVKGVDLRAADLLTGDFNFEGAISAKDSPMPADESNFLTPGEREGRSASPTAPRTDEAVVAQGPDTTGESADAAPPPVFARTGDGGPVVEPTGLRVPEGARLGSRWAIGSIVFEMAFAPGTDPRTGAAFAGLVLATDDSTSGRRLRAAVANDLGAIKEHLCPYANVLIVDSVYAVDDGELVEAGGVTYWARDQSGAPTTLNIAISARDENPLGALVHETVHYLVKTGSLTEDEQAILATSPAVHLWGRAYDIGRYGNLGPAAYFEEALAHAVADAFGSWERRGDDAGWRPSSNAGGAAGDAASPLSVSQTLFPPPVREVFARIFSGEVGSRFPTVGIGRETVMAAIDHATRGRAAAFAEWFAGSVARAVDGAPQELFLAVGGDGRLAAAGEAEHLGYGPAVYVASTPGAAKALRPWDGLWTFRNDLPPEHLERLLIERFQRAKEAGRLPGYGPEAAAYFVANRDRVQWGGLVISGLDLRDLAWPKADVSTYQVLAAIRNPLDLDTAMPMATARALWQACEAGATPAALFQEALWPNTARTSGRGPDFQVDRNYTEKEAATLWQALVGERASGAGGSGGTGRGEPAGVGGDVLYRALHGRLGSPGAVDAALASVGFGGISDPRGAVADVRDPRIAGKSLYHMLEVALGDRTIVNERLATAGIDGLSYRLAAGEQVFALFSATQVSSVFTAAFGAADWGALHQAENRGPESDPVFARRGRSVMDPNQFDLFAPIGAPERAPAQDAEIEAVEHDGADSVGDTPSTPPPYEAAGRIGIGSLVGLSTFPPERRQTLLRVIAELPVAVQRFVEERNVPFQFTPRDHLRAMDDATALPFRRSGGAYAAPGGRLHLLEEAWPPSRAAVLRELGRMAAADAPADVVAAAEAGVAGHGALIALCVSGLKRAGGFDAATQAAAVAAVEALAAPATLNDLLAAPSAPLSEVAATVVPASDPAYATLAVHVHLMRAAGRRPAAVVDELLARRAALLPSFAEKLFTAATTVLADRSLLRTSGEQLDRLAGAIAAADAPLAEKHDLDAQLDELREPGRMLADHLRGTVTREPLELDLLRAEIAACVERAEALVLAAGINPMPEPAEPSARTTPSAPASEAQPQDTPALSAEPEGAVPDSLPALRQALRAEFPTLRYQLTDVGHPSRPVVAIDKLLVPEAERGTGTGTTALRRITRWADAHGVTLSFSPTRDLGGSVAGLQRWARQGGFAANVGEDRDAAVPGLMRRLPGEFTPGRQAPVVERPKLLPPRDWLLWALDPRRLPEALPLRLLAQDDLPGAARVYYAPNQAPVLDASSDVTALASDRRILWSASVLPLVDQWRLGVVPVGSAERAGLLQEWYEASFGGRRGYCLGHSGTDALRGVIITPSAQRPGLWQSTFFDATGFARDTQRATLAQAMQEALEDGYRRPAPELIADVMSFESFHAGNARTEALNEERYPDGDGPHSGTAEIGTHQEERHDGERDGDRGDAHGGAGSASQADGDRDPGSPAAADDGAADALGWIDFRGSDEWPGDARLQFAELLSRLPAEMQRFVRERDVPFRYTTRADIEQMPAEFQGAFQTATAVTWNAMRIHILADQFPQPASVAHELAHMAAPFLPPTMFEDAERVASEHGARIVEATRSRRQIPGLSDEERRTARSDIARMNEAPTRVELSLMQPSTAVGKVAQALGLPADDQYCVLAVHAYLARQAGVTVDMREAREEVLAYRVPLSSRLSAAVFGHAADRLELDRVVTDARQRIDIVARAVAHDLPLPPSERQEAQQALAEASEPLHALWEFAKGRDHDMAPARRADLRSALEDSVRRIVALGDDLHQRFGSLGASTGAGVDKAPSPTADAPGLDSALPLDGDLVVTEAPAHGHLQAAIPPAPAEDPTGTPPFKAGDRVVDQRDRRHGTVVEVQTLRFVALFGGTASEPLHHYEVKTDAGAVRTVGQRDLEIETGEPPMAVADPVVDGRAVEPKHLQGSIAYDRGAADAARGRAERRRTPERAVEDRRDAALADARAQAKEAIFARWVVEHWPAAKALGLNDDHRDLYRYLQRSSLTAAEEHARDMWRRRAAASPDKWAVGDGVGYRVAQSGNQQINRGFRIVSLDREARTVMVAQVADTGLTSSGGHHDRFEPLQVHIGDLVRDRAYDRGQERNIGQGGDGSVTPPRDGVGEALTLQRTTHTRQGHDLFVVGLARRLDRLTYDALSQKARDLGGKWSSYARDGAVPGFQFRSAANALRFLELNGAPHDVLAQQAGLVPELATDAVVETQASEGPSGERVPPAVLGRVNRALEALRSYAEALDGGRSLDARFGGGGRYEADVSVNRASDRDAPLATLAEFRLLAPKNNVDAEAVLAGLGGVPDVRLTPGAEEWLRDARSRLDSRQEPPSSALGPDEANAGVPKDTLAPGASATARVEDHATALAATPSPAAPPDRPTPSPSVLPPDEPASLFDFAQAKVLESDLITPVREPPALADGLVGVTALADSAPNLDGHLGGGAVPGDWVTFRIAGQQDLAPVGQRAKVRANLEALVVLDVLRRDRRPATAAEQSTLARYSGWGHTPQLFDDGNAAWSDERTRLQGLLSQAEYAAARFSTINAHFTGTDVIDGMWQAVRDLGFRSGRVLEPGCGIGNFVGSVPPDMGVQFVGVELEPVTARIARALYPDAEIRSEGFEESRLPRDSMDLVIGNVPFADVRLVDHAHNKGNHTLHNHFIIKSLNLLAPGGVLAVVTSRYTLDARNPAARRDMADSADLLGALRLPETAFRAVAGTDAVTDILVMRKRLPGEARLEQSWLGTIKMPVERVGSASAGPSDVADATGEAVINTYFVEQPDNILGRCVVSSGRFGADTVTVLPNDDRPLREQIAAGVQRIVEQAVARGRGWQAEPSREITLSARPVIAAAPVKESALYVDSATNQVMRMAYGYGVAVELSPRESFEVRALVRLRDVLGEVLAAQMMDWDGQGDEPWRAPQERLNAAYDAYVAEYGAINRYRLQRHGTDPETGEPRYYRRYPTLGGFRADPDFPALKALELFDDESQRAAKADIFNARVISPQREIRGVESPGDALLAVLNATGRVDLDRMAELLACSRDEVITDLRGSIFLNPKRREWETADAYLSGNVRGKLADARDAAVADPQFDLNVTALEAVQPRDLVPSEIDARLGAPWLATSDIEAFVDSVLQTEGTRVIHIALTATWSVRSSPQASSGTLATNEWGTNRRSAIDLVDDLLNQRTIEVWDYHSDGSRTKNADATLAALEKAEKLSDHFSKWIWEAPDRAQRLAKGYNETYNNTVLRSFNGQHLTLPGSNEAIQLRPHQKNAVWRVLQDGNVLIAHVVGAGKTYTAIAAAMEGRRLGVMNKPAVCVPNHMLEQFSREFLQLYPNASLLIVDKDSVTPENRKTFVARCATGNWDAVIFTHRTFEAIPMSLEYRQSYLQAQSDELREAIVEAETNEERDTVKQLEKLLKRAEERHKRLMGDERKDDGLTFEQTGIDFVFVDEFHLFKNLAFTTRMKYVAAPASQRAEDMFMKVRYLEGQNPGRSLVGMTGTPIANQVSEMYTQQRYFQGTHLGAVGLDQFDGWAANFGTTVVSLELAPDGGSWRMQERFAKYRNVPELMTMFRSFADVQTADLLNLPTPKLRGGKPEVVTVPASEGLKAFVQTLVERVEMIKRRLVDPSVDNMLRVTGDGRKAALDLRLVGLDPDPAGGKIGAMVDRIVEIHETNRDKVFRGDDGRPSMLRGALQVVFCDLSTPNPSIYNAYADVKERLIERGIPGERVRFVHEAADDTAKARLFNECRSGKVSVLLGSTEKMGVGTNIQKRLVALHHLDAPWRPADVEQREGRILRQGNENEEVRVLRYGAEGSFDVYMWQGLERKAKFIAQVMTGRLDAREIDEVDGSALSYGEAKALLTGNPLILEKAGVDAELGKLERLAVAHEREQSSLFWRQKSERSGITSQEESIADIDSALAQRQDTSGDAFRMTVRDRIYSVRKEAGTALLQAASKVFLRSLEAESNVRETVGSLGGFPVSVSAGGADGRDGFAIELVHPKFWPKRFELAVLKEGSPVGIVVQLENEYRDLEGSRAACERRIADARTELDRIEARIGQPFPHAERLAVLRERQAAINAELFPKEEAPVIGGPEASAGVGTAPASDAATPVAGAKEERSYEAGKQKALSFQRGDYFDYRAFAREIGRAAAEGNQPRARGLADALATKGFGAVLDVAGNLASPTDEFRGQDAARPYVVAACGKLGMAAHVAGGGASDDVAFAAWRSALAQERAARALAAGDGAMDWRFDGAIGRDAVYALAVIAAGDRVFPEGAPERDRVRSGTLALIEEVVARESEAFRKAHDAGASHAINSFFANTAPVLRSVRDRLEPPYDTAFDDRRAAGEIDRERRPYDLGGRPLPSYEVSAAGNGILDLVRAPTGTEHVSFLRPPGARAATSAPPTDTLLGQVQRISGLGNALERVVALCRFAQELRKLEIEAAPARDLVAANSRAVDDLLRAGDAVVRSSLALHRSLGMVYREPGAVAGMVAVYIERGAVAQIRAQLATAPGALGELLGGFVDRAARQAAMDEARRLGDVVDALAMALATEDRARNSVTQLRDTEHTLGLSEAAAAARTLEQLRAPGSILYGILGSGPSKAVALSDAIVAHADQVMDSVSWAVVATANVPAVARESAFDRLERAIRAEERVQRADSAATPAEAWVARFDAAVQTAAENVEARDRLAMFGDAFNARHANRLATEAQQDAAGLAPVILANPTMRQVAESRALIGLLTDVQASAGHELSRSGVTADYEAEVE